MRGTLVADYGESVDDALYHASANVGWETLFRYRRGN